MIRFGQPFCRVKGEVKREGREIEVRELVIQAKPSYKRFRIDEVSKRLLEILGTLPSVLFQPDDSDLVFGSPSYRRQTVDRLLSQTDIRYAKTLQQYQKVLKQRNRLLKQVQEGRAREDELDYWDEEMGTAAEAIQHDREDLVTWLQTRVAATYANLVPQHPDLELHYHRSPSHQHDSFATHLKENRFKETSAGSSLYGPHREDILFSYGGHPVSEAFSRGQSRALVLAFKLAELEYIEERTGTRPLLLLDDIFSEFDAERRERIIGLITAYQTVMTCTEIDGLAERLPRTATIVPLA